MEETAVGGKEADGLGVEDRVRFVVHAVVGEEESKARMEEAVVYWVCTITVSPFVAVVQGF